jgi:hypothetical protein
VTDLVEVLKGGKKITEKSVLDDSMLLYDSLSASS